MVESNHGDLSLSKWWLKKATTNERNTDVGNKTIQNGVNTDVGISIDYGTIPFFGLEVNVFLESRISMVPVFLLVVQLILGI